MEIREFDKGRHIKERNSLEKYLSRIINRYFVVESKYTQSSIEAIIVESLTRLKNSLLSEKGFLFSFNGLTGHVILTIDVFKGEPAFAKNTAFNKDFGNEEDTICEGNDPRLYDARDPLGHVHHILNIDQLREELDKCGIFPDTHYHDNKDILDLLRYAGEKTQIDLIFVESTVKAIEEYIKMLEYYKQELKVYHEDILDKLIYISEQITTQLEIAQETIKTVGIWLNTAKEYTNTKSSLFNIIIRRMFKDYVTKEQMEELLAPVIYLTAEGEIPLNLTPDISLTPIEESDDIAGDGNGDTLKEIYESGIQKGEQKWQWNDSKQSFVFQENLSVHSVFLSPNTYSDYIHRVTLASSDGDDDIISVILAYDDETENMLSLMCTGGGVVATGHVGPQAGIVLNFDNAWEIKPFDNMMVSLTDKESSEGWSWWSNGMPVLVKREGNTFKIWILYNTPHSWNVSNTGDGHKDIITDTDPTFELNMEDYPELECFCDKEVRYGYGCYSQSMSTYSNVCFIARKHYDEWHGYTNVNQQSEQSVSVPDDIMATFQGGHAKLFFRYGSGDDIYTYPLPYMFLSDDNVMTVIQGEYTENGTIKITTNLMQSFNEYIDENNFWNDNTIIAPNGINDSSYSGTAKPLCLIDSEEKHNFVCSLLKENKEYFIQGSQFGPDGPEWYAGEDEMTYFNWDVDEPQSYDMTNIIYINSNRKWSSTGYYTSGKGYVAEYKLKSLSDYYENPRIYYQVYGQMKEGE